MTIQERSRASSSCPPGPEEASPPGGSKQSCRVLAGKIAIWFHDVKSGVSDGLYVPAIAISLAVAPTWAAEQKQNWTWCVNDQHIFAPDLRITGCTAVIQLGERHRKTKPSRLCTAGTHIERKATSIKLFPTSMKRSASPKLCLGYYKSRQRLSHEGRLPSSTCRLQRGDSA
jgi:hypothetical protein